MIYLRARYYDAGIGRFISEDPAAVDLNWYVYCLNNPINRIDPFGFDSYILYDPNDTGNNTFVSKEKAETMKKELEDNYGTPSHLIPIDSYEYFVKKFNHIGRNGEGVDAVVLYFHGNYNRIAFRNSSGPGFQNKRFTTNNMGEITNTRAMDALILLGCYNADDSGGSTLANAFAKMSNINVVAASDGATYTDKMYIQIGTVYGPSYPYSYTRITTIANPNGFKVYWKGVGTPVNIGSSFEGLGILVSAARYAKFGR